MAWEVWLTFFGAAIAMLTSMRPSALARLEDWRRRSARIPGCR